ncbi:MAG: hypothetical protein KC656_12905, partial [Myxococcales bacterium]|nr:hypothetical protein [Myxococcales bacterium]
VVDLEKMGGSAAVLAKGRATLDRGTLTVALHGGRELAEGRRALRDPTVVELVARHYGERVKVDVDALLDTGTENDRQKALARKVLADPDVKRVVDALGATLLRAVPLTDGE